MRIFAAAINRRGRRREHFAFPLRRGERRKNFVQIVRRQKQIFRRQCRAMFVNFGMRPPPLCLRNESLKRFAAAAPENNHCIRLQIIGQSRDSFKKQRQKKLFTRRVFVAKNCIGGRIRNVAEARRKRAAKSRDSRRRQIAFAGGKQIQFRRLAR